MTQDGQQPDVFSSLPQEMKERVLYYLAAKDLATVSMVSRSLMPIKSNLELQKGTFDDYKGPYDSISGGG